MDDELVISDVESQASGAQTAQGPELARPATQLLSLTEQSAKALRTVQELAGCNASTDHHELMEKGDVAVWRSNVTGPSQGVQSMKVINDRR